MLFKPFILKNTFISQYDLSQLSQLFCVIFFSFIPSFPFSTNFYTKRTTFKAVFFDFKNARLFLNRFIQSTEKKVSRRCALLLLLRADVTWTVTVVLYRKNCTWKTFNPFPVLLWCVKHSLYLTYIIENNNLAVYLVIELRILSNISLSVTWVEFPAMSADSLQTSFTHMGSRMFTWRHRALFLEITSLAGGISRVLAKLIALCWFTPGKHPAKIQFSFIPILKWTYYIEACGPKIPTVHQHLQP